MTDTPLAALLDELATANYIWGVFNERHDLRQASEAANESAAARAAILAEFATLEAKYDTLLEESNTIGGALFDLAHRAKGEEYEVQWIPLRADGVSMAGILTRHLHPGQRVRVVRVEEGT